MASREHYPNARKVDGASAWIRLDDVAGPWRDFDGTIAIDPFFDFLAMMRNSADREDLPALLGNATHHPIVDIRSAFRTHSGRVDFTHLDEYLKHIQKIALEQHNKASQARHNTEMYLSDVGRKEPTNEIVGYGLLPSIRPPSLRTFEGKELFHEESSHRPADFIIGSIDELIAHLAADPQQLYSMPPRKFEELVARLIERLGYRVELTQATRDGGRDVLARRSDDFVETLLIVECKRYAPERLVGVHHVRSLYGVLQFERATTAMIVATSGFSRDAKNFAEPLRYQLQLRDYDNIISWLKKP